MQVLKKNQLKKLWEFKKRRKSETDVAIYL